MMLAFLEIQPSTRSSAAKAASVACLLLLASCAKAPPRPSDGEALLPRSEGANVLVITFDALRADALGLYGYPLDTSPNIDRFAEGSLVFERAFSAAPVTPTSFAAMFTGTLPTTSFRGWQLEPVPTLAESFTKAGYQTAAFLNNSQLTRERGFHRGFGHFQVFSGPDEEVLGRTSSWLRSAAREPFFAWVHFISPHSPYDWREGSKHFYDPDYEGPFTSTTTASFTPEDPADRARVRSLYDGEIYFADQLFASLLDTLEAERLDRNTLVVVTADHGEEFGEHGRYQHWSLHDASVRVPLLIRSPASETGRRIETPVSLLDLWPTLASAVGIEPPSIGDGTDFSTSVPEDRALVSVAMTDSKYQALSLTRDGWRLIVDCRPQRTLALFDLKAGRGSRALARSEAERTRALLQELRGLLNGAPCQSLRDAIQGKSPTEGLDADTIEQLRALGYLD